MRLSSVSQSVSSTVTAHCDKKKKTVGSQQTSDKTGGLPKVPKSARSSGFASNDPFNDPLNQLSSNYSSGIPEYGDYDPLNLNPLNASLNQLNQQYSNPSLNTPEYSLYNNDSPPLYNNTYPLGDPSEPFKNTFASSSFDQSQQYPAFDGNKPLENTFASSNFNQSEQYPAINELLANNNPSDLLNSASHVVDDNPFAQPDVRRKSPPTSKQKPTEQASPTIDIKSVVIPQTSEQIKAEILQLLAKFPIDTTDKGKRTNPKIGKNPQGTQEDLLRLSALLKEVKDKKIDIAIPPIEQRIKLYTKFFEGKLTTKPEQVQGVETEIDPWVEFNNSCLTAESQTNPAIETTTEPAVIVAETESVSKPTPQPAINLKANNLKANQSYKALETELSAYLANPADVSKLNTALNALKADSSLPAETQTKIGKIVTATISLGKARKTLTEQEKAASDYNKANNSRTGIFAVTADEKYHKRVKKEENYLATLLLDDPEEKSRGFAWSDYVARLETSSPNYGFSIKEFESSLRELSELTRRLEASLIKAKSEYGDNSPLVKTIETVIKQREEELKTEQAKYVEYSKLLLTDNVVDSYLKSRVTEDSRLGGGSLSLNEKLAVFVRLKNKLEKAINYTKLVEGADSDSAKQLEQALEYGLVSYRARLVDLYPEFGNKTETFELLLQLGETQRQLEIVNRANFNEANKNRTKTTQLENDIARISRSLNDQLTYERQARADLESKLATDQADLNSNINRASKLAADQLDALERTLGDELGQTRTELGQTNTKVTGLESELGTTKTKLGEAETKLSGLETKLGERVTMPMEGGLAAVLAAVSGIIAYFAAISGNKKDDKASSADESKKKMV